MLCFVRDITAANRARRELTRERDSYRLAFEKSPVAEFVLLHNGYISLMNEACRKLMGLTETDKNFYRYVYVRPALTLNVRRKLRSGEPAEMDYTLNFARAAEKFPGRIDGEKPALPLYLRFRPINRRDGKDGTIQSDYAVTVEVRGAKQEGALIPVCCVSRCRRCR